MNKEIKKTLKKIEDLMLSYQKEKSNKFFSYSGLIDFKAIDKKNHILIGINLMDDGEREAISINNVLEKIKDFFIHNGNSFQNSGIPIPIVMPLDGKVRYKSLTNFLLKENLSENLEDKIIFALFSSKYTDIYEESVKHISELVKNNPTENKKGKSLALKIISRIGSIGSPLVDQPYYHVSDFGSICKSLTKLKVGKEDYTVLHHLFSYYSKTISDTSNGMGVLVKFLKESIPTEDWKEFKVYIGDEKKIDSNDNKNNNLFEEKHNPKYHLIINEEWTVGKYPVLSLSSDYFNMISLIVKHINLNKEELGLEVCKILSTESKRTELYFLSKDENPVKQELIKGLLKSVIGIYAESQNNKSEITDEFLRMTFKATMLAVSLEQSIGFSVEKSRIKANKI